MKTTILTAIVCTAISAAVFISAKPANRSEQSRVHKYLYMRVRGNITTVDEFGTFREESFKDGTQEKFTQSIAQKLNDLGRQHYRLISYTEYDKYQSYVFERDE